MTAREFSLWVKEQYRKKEVRFFTEKALLCALFEKNELARTLALTDPDFLLFDELCEKMKGECRRLLEGEPLQYYLGSEYFCGEEFLVGEGVLIPRPETELLVRHAVCSAPEGACVFDLCCGSGCVGISLLKAREDVRVVAFDLSPVCLATTEENARRLGVSDRLKLVSCDVTSPDILSYFQIEKPSLVLANPPYLTERELDEIEANVRREPSLALDGGPDGLRFYRAFAALSRQTGIPFLCEMGCNQQNGVRETFEKEGISCEFFTDFSSLPRLFRAERKKER